MCAKWCKMYTSASDGATSVFTKGSSPINYNDNVVVTTEGTGNLKVNGGHGEMKVHDSCFGFRTNDGEWKRDCPKTKCGGFHWCQVVTGSGGKRGPNCQRECTIMNVRR